MWPCKFFFYTHPSSRPSFLTTYEQQPMISIVQLTDKAHLRDAGGGENTQTPHNSAWDQDGNPGPCIKATARQQCHRSTLWIIQRSSVVTENTNCTLPPPSITWNEGILSFKTTFFVRLEIANACVLLLIIFRTWCPVNFIHQNNRMLIAVKLRKLKSVIVPWTYTWAKGHNVLE